MTSMEPLSGRRDFNGGYKVDVSRGERVGRVSSEWFSRPADERFLSLSELFASVRGRAEHRGLLGQQPQSDASRLQARLGSSRQSCAVQAQRPDARRAADRRHRFPRLRHLGESRRQSQEDGRPSLAIRRWRRVSAASRISTASTVTAHSQLNLRRRRKGATPPACRTRPAQFFHSRWICPPASHRSAIFNGFQNR